MLVRASVNRPENKTIGKPTDRTQVSHIIICPAIGAYVSLIAWRIDHIHRPHDNSAPTGLCADIVMAIGANHTDMVDVHHVAGFVVLATNSTDRCVIVDAGFAIVCTVYVHGIPGMILVAPWAIDRFAAIDAALAIPIAFADNGAVAALGN